MSDADQNRRIQDTKLRNPMTVGGHFTCRKMEGAYHNELPQDQKEMRQPAAAGPYLTGMRGMDPISRSRPFALMRHAGS